LSDGPNTLRVPAPKDGNPRPVVAVLADNAGTETIDFVVPYSILRDSAVAEVISASPASGVVKLMPALTIHADMTFEEFDRTHAAGADIVIVPALHDRRAPHVVGWLRSQAHRGAIVVGICEGAWTLAEAGLLHGKQATTHWFSMRSIARYFPTTTWRRDRRFVIDGKVMTTAGVSASIPASLAIVDSIAGNGTALATAQRLGIEAWDPRHNSRTFALGLDHVMTVAGNRLFAWRHETIAFPVDDNCDEIALALAADAWSRTYRSRARAVNDDGRVTCRHGLQLVTERLPPASQALVGALASSAGYALNHALLGIAGRYGRSTAELVSLGLEYRPEVPEEGRGSGRKDIGEE